MHSWVAIPDTEDIGPFGRPTYSVVRGVIGVVARGIVDSTSGDRGSDRLSPPNEIVRMYTLLIANIANI